jgi:hypothetical protein
VLPQLLHTLASRATTAWHDGQRVGFENVDRTRHTKKAIAPAMTMTIA